MSKQAANKVSTIKQSNGQYTGTGKETLSELFRVHFPDSKLIDDLDRLSETWTLAKVGRTGQTVTWPKS
jgi:hypothetical protein